MGYAMVEQFHWSLHNGLSHYVDATGTIWDIVVPFFFMEYRATPHITTKYSSFYLHEREMNLPTQDNLRAKLPEEIQNSEHATRLENLEFNKKNGV
jgi:hypothetical protein